MVLENGFWNFDRIISIMAQNHITIVSITRVVANTGIIVFLISMG